MSISKKDIRMLKHALDVSDMSDFPKYHIGCVVALKGKVLNASFNSEKTHPLQKIFNKQRFSCDNTPHSLHAEIHALAPLQNEDIDWKNYKLNVIQPKTNNLNILPLSKEVGWAIINYIKNSRPKCNNEYLFVKMKYPFEKMEQFNNFNKYFEKCNLEENIKKGIHNLRHSFATNMLDNDIPIHIISSVLGHSDINTTSSTYIKIDTKNLKKVCLEVDE